MCHANFLHLKILYHDMEYRARCSTYLLTVPNGRKIDHLWAKNRLKDIDAVENEDYEGAKILAPSGQSKKDHIIKFDTAKVGT